MPILLIATLWNDENVGELSIPLYAVELVESLTKGFRTLQCKWANFYQMILQGEYAWSWNQNEISIAQRNELLLVIYTSYGL